MRNRKIIYRNEYYENMKFILYYYRIIGIYPFEIDEQEKRRTWLNIFFKITDVISKIICVSFLAWHSFFAFNFFRVISTDFNFQKFLFDLPILLGQFVPTLVIFVTWNKKDMVTRYINDWYTFQNDYANRIARSARLNTDETKKRINLTLLIGQLGNFIGYFILFYFGYRLNFRISFICLCYQITITCSLIHYWYSNCLFVRVVAEKLTDDMQEAIYREDCRKFKELIRMWLRLSNLLEDFSKNHISSVFLIHFVVSFANCVFVTYLMVLFQQSEPGAHLMLKSLVILPFISPYAYCELAHNVKETVVNKTQETLLKLNMMRMNVKILSEIYSFLQFIDSRDLNIVLHGSLPLTRSSFLSMLLLAITNVIVLRQFHENYAGMFNGFELDLSNAILDV